MRNFPGSKPSASRNERKRTVFPKAIQMKRSILLCIALAGFAASVWAGEHTSSLAVFAFENLTGSEAHDWIGTGFAQALTDKLGTLDRLMLRDRREVADLVRVSQLSPEAIRAGDAGQLGSLAESDYLIFGSVQAAGDVSHPEAPLRVTGRLVETRTGLISEAVQLDGIMGELFSLQSRMALRFAELLSVEVSMVARQGMERNGTASLAAYKSYCEGLRLLDRLEFEKAIACFRAALRLHPGVLYAESHHALGTAYLRSGRKAEMLSAFNKDVQRLSGIWFDLGMAYEKNSQFDQAAEAYQTFVIYTDRRFSPWQYSGAEESSLPRNWDDKDNLILPQSDGRFHCLDTRSGRVRWLKQFPSFNPPLTLSGGYAYFAAKDGTVRAVNALTGETRWSVPGDAAALPIRMLSESRRVLVATTKGEVVALDADSGAVVWIKPLDCAVTGLDARGEWLYAADERGGVRALNVKQGDTRWEIVTPARVEQTFARTNQVGVLTADGKMFSLDSTSGRINWSYTSLQPAGLAAPVAGGYALLADHGAVAYVDDDGKECWRYRSVSPPRWLLGIGEHVLLAGSLPELIILDRASGVVRERRTLPAAIREITLSGNTVVVLLADGSVHALSFALGVDEPDDLEGYLRLGEALARGGKLEDAAGIYRLILGRLDPLCAQAMHALADVYEKQKKHDLAREMLNRARQSALRVIPTE
jgi:outer membrane protein assembly factor BamB/TolB-like protein